MVWYLRRFLIEGNDYFVVVLYNERSVEFGLKRILLFLVEINFMFLGSFVLIMLFDWIVNEKCRVFEVWN